MGYTNRQSQLMSVPPYVLGCIVTTGGFLSDRSKKRGPYMIFFCLVAIIGFVMLISTHKPHVQYIGTFLVVSGYVICVSYLPFVNDVKQNLPQRSFGCRMERKQHWRCYQASCWYCHAGRLR
jgi:hypothetical protein